MWLTCGWLFNWVYTLPPTSLWKPPEAMMSASTLVATNLIGIVISFLFVIVFYVLYKGIPGKGVKKGLCYGLILWLVGALSGMASMPFFMNIAVGVIIYWILAALVSNLIGGAIVGALYKK